MKKRWTNRTKMIDQLIHRDTSVLRHIVACPPEQPCKKTFEGKSDVITCEECLNNWLDTEVEWTPENDGMDTDGH